MPDLHFYLADGSYLGRRFLFDQSERLGDATKLTASVGPAAQVKPAQDEQLRARGIEDSDSVCTALAEGLKGHDFGGAQPAQSPDEIFRRLGGGK